MKLKNCLNTIFFSAIQVSSYIESMTKEDLVWKQKSKVHTEADLTKAAAVSFIINFLYQVNNWLIIKNY